MISRWIRLSHFFFELINYSIINWMNTLRFHLSTVPTITIHFHQYTNIQNEIENDRWQGCDTN